MNLMFFPPSCHVERSRDISNRIYGDQRFLDSGALSLHCAWNDKKGSSTRLCNSRNHAFAAIAQIGMCLAHPDGWPMTPATRALSISRFGDAGGCCLPFVNREIAQDEKLFQFFFVDLFSDIGIRM